MKKLNKGFSLAELLIALAIISIISILGMSISKKGMEKAYNLYIYNAYSSIHNAIADAKNQGYEIESNNVNNCNFTRHIVRIFNAEDRTDDGIPASDNRTYVRFRAENGVEFYIKKLSAYWNLTESPAAGEFQNTPIYLIKITVPAMPKKVNGTVRRTSIFSFYYVTGEKSYDFIIPAGAVIDDKGDDYATNYINLQTRKDLLPFYIDDGLKGKYIQYCVPDENDLSKCTLDDTPKHKGKREILSFKDAFCKVKNNSIKFVMRTQDLSNNNVLFYKYGSSKLMGVAINCDTDADTDGAIRVVDPRKVF
jgi:prepilin-type N-terminal cleavage/methylation domain-containing protein